MAVNVTVRAAVPEDLTTVVGLDTASSGMAKPDYWEGIFKTYVPDQKGERYLLVAEVGGQPVGFVVGEVRAWEFGSPPCGWVFGLGVDNDHREHHVGSLLMEAIFARFRDDKVTSVRTNVSRLDTLNLSFFRSLGMTAGPYVQLEISLDDDQAAS